jgi:hypothetical protein
LTALLGRPAVDGAGAALGKLDDLGVQLTSEHPPVIAARMRGRGAPTLACALVRVTADELVVVEGSAHPGDLLYLRRHVLDAQVLTLDGQRLVRVGDVFVAEEGEGLALTGVEVGTAPVLRRLGLARFLSGGADEILDWRELHLASAPGHVLQLASGAAGVHRLTAPQLEALAGALPAARAHELRRHFRLPSRPQPPPARRRGRRFGSVLRARSRAPR